MRTAADFRHLPAHPVIEWALEDASRPETTTRCVARLAGRQDGMVARSQLLALGLHPRAISRLVGRGELLEVHRGVYALGHLPRTHRARWSAAVLACGPGAALSHGTAAALLGLLRPPGRVHVTSPDRRRRAGIVTHRATVEVVLVGGLPCTTVARTAVDLAGSAPRVVLGAAVREAQRRGVLDVRAIADVLLAHPRARGARTLRALLEDPVELAPTRSAPEREALRMVLREGLPWPVVNGMLAGFEVDLHWPGQRVVVEVDGPHHLLGEQRRRDRERDRDLHASGWTVLRVAHDRVATVAGPLRAALAA